MLSACFRGDWLAALDYLQAPPRPDEEVITALPETRLFVGLSSQAARLAAEQGIPEEEIHAMLAAFLGTGTAQSPVEERVTALRGWWEAFDQVHAVQKPGLRPLWGLVDDIPPIFTHERGYTPRLYRDVLPMDITHAVDRLWGNVTLQRHPGSIVSNPHPHQQMAKTLGPAAEFWHGVALTAWYVCEGPSSRASLPQLADYYRRPLAALAAAGTPVDPALFEELKAAEQHLGPEQAREAPRSESESDPELGTFTFSDNGWIRRDGFEQLCDIITRHRRAWAAAHLETYLSVRWRTELQEVAHAHHRIIASKGRPPSLTQFAKFAATAANHWTGGDLSALSTAVGEPAPTQQQRPPRLLPGDGYDVAHRVYKTLGGQHLNSKHASHDPEAAHRDWALTRLAGESLHYIQLQEALGAPPSPQQFNAHRLTWPWPGGQDEGWPLFQSVLATVTSTPPSSAAITIP